MKNDLQNIFKNTCMFSWRFIQPTIGLKNAYKIYKIFAPFYPIWKTLFLKHVCTLEDLGQAMMNTNLHGYDKKVLDNIDIAKQGNKRTAL